MAIEPISAEIGPWHWVLRPRRLKEFVGIDPAMPAVPVARWIAFRPQAGRQAAVADRLRSVFIAGTDLPLFHVDVHRDEVIVKLALWQKSLPDRTELETLQVRYHGRTAPFSEIARRFGYRRSAMHDEGAVLILAGPRVRHADIGTARLIDVAPTLLRIAGVDDSSGLDGRVLDVF
jgi:hypothetical protein